MDSSYVLRRIISFAINPRPVSIHEWKRNLLLLHICTEWTGFLICDIFKYAYIQAKRESADRGVGIVDSNFELIRDRGMEDYVQMVTVDSAGQPSCILNDVAELLNKLDLYCPGVVCLRFTRFSLASSHSLCHPSRCNPEEPPVEYDVACYKERFSNVSMLDFASSFQGVLRGNHDAAVLDFSQKLVVSYLDQLRTVDGAFLIRKPLFKRFPDNMVYLSLRMDTAVERVFPQTSSASLRHLCLEHISPSLEWLSFVYYNGLANFDNLVVLKLLYNTRKTWAGFDYKSVFDGRFEKSPGFVVTEFPRLEYLEIVNPSLGCHVLFTKSFPRLKTLKLNCMAPTIFPVNKSAIGKLETLDIDLQSVGYYSADVDGLEGWLKSNFRSKNPIYQTINLLLEKVTPGSSSRLRIEDDNEGFVLDTSQINWIYLKRLDLHCPIELSSLLDMLRRFVYLECLSVESIRFNEGDCFEFANNGQIAPLNSSLSMLDLPFVCEKSNDLVSLITVLVSKLAGLKTLRVPESLFDEVNSAVKDLQGSYKHLRTLAIDTVNSVEIFD